MTYTSEHLTNLLTTDREKLTRVCAEVCYGAEKVTFEGVDMADGPSVNVCVLWRDDWVIMRDFQPLADTEKGRSQAFELAVKFDCFPFFNGGSWVAMYNVSELYDNENPQHAIVIAAILIAQQENNDE